MQFYITIFGELQKKVADALWLEIKPTGSNFTVLDKKAFIYGDADVRIVNRLVMAASRTGFEVERSDAYD